ncbi:MAG: diphthine synthase [Candidatus Thermoplasmatota archaeon]
MGELVFIGIGIHEPKDTTLTGLEEARNCKILFCEFYTSRPPSWYKKKLEKLIGRKIEVLKREDIENGKILEYAKKMKVGFLCLGDPMVATTHLSLRLRAHEMGIKTKIIFAQSVYTVVPSSLGLQHCKFGRTTTIPFPKKNYFPESPYDVIVKNKKNGLHSLVLLDIGMKPNEAIKILFELEERKKLGIFNKKIFGCVVGNAGSKKPIIYTDYLYKIAEKRFISAQWTLVIPGKLHFLESEALLKFANAKVIS